MEILIRIQENFSLNYNIYYNQINWLKIIAL